MKSQFNESVQIHDPMMNCELKTLTAPPIPLPQRKRTETKKKKINDVDGISLMSLQMSCQVDGKKKKPAKE
jgi:hypothetical protein